MLAQRAEFILIILKIACNAMINVIFLYGCEPVLTQRILIGFETILKKMKEGHKDRRQLVLGCDYAKKGLFMFNRSINLKSKNEMTLSN